MYFIQHLQCDPTDIWLVEEKPVGVLPDEVVEVVAEKGLYRLLCLFHGHLLLCIVGSHHQSASDRLNDHAFCVALVVELGDHLLDIFSLVEGDPEKDLKLSEHQ